MTKANKLMPSLLDRQISAADQDAFGHRHFADALRSLTESEMHDPPFSIGLLGGWGTGKSTIKEIYVRELQNDSRKNDSNHTRSERFRTITFNAWRFGGKEQDIKRALLRHVFLELGGDEENLQDHLFRQIKETHEYQKGYWQYTWEILKAWSMPIPAFVISLLLLVGLLALVFFIFPVQDELAKSLIILTFTGAYTFLLKQIKAPPVAGHRSITRIALPSTTAEQYEDLLLEQITVFKSGKSKSTDCKKGKDCERLIVFVDDLDRLSAEEMVLGLDAVRTFMEIPKARLPNRLGLVFVISCDEAKVAHALAERRRQGDMPGTVFSQSDARRYLDRIFQFRLEIPPFPRQDMRQYAIKRLKELPGIEADLNDSNTSIEAVIDRMIHVGVHNPRNALQIVNAFSQAWWLAKKRETEELGTGRAGGLHEGAVTAHPVSLGALSAIKVNFPDFYRDLQNDPGLLDRITDVLVRGKPLKEQPLTTQQLLIEHYLIKKDSADEKNEPRSEHRPLRQFLASLTGLRWPDSLQSLLILSEDPITRNFGAKASTIYEALVSGDTQGVLEGLGRHIDALPLKPDDARLLYQMTEELRNESTLRRIHATRVIADLIDRMPEQKAQLLIGSICRELGDSADFRSQLGLHKIEKVLTVANGEDRRAVASRLVEDVLTLEDDVRFRLESMEPPNLEEALTFARSTVNMVLPIRRDNNLDPSSDSLFLSWLVDRTVRVNGKYHQLTFKELEQWMVDHEDHILPALSDRYTDILVSELEGKAAPSFDIPPAIDRARKVFGWLWDAGEDTRKTLWRSLTRYIALKQPEALQVAWEVMVEHITSIDASQFSVFVTAFVERLSDEAKAKAEEWDIDFLSIAAQALLTLIRTRHSDLDEGTLQKISELAILWSQNDETGSQSCDIVKELYRKDATVAQPIFDKWSQRVLDDLPIDCIKLLASLFTKLEDPIQSKVVANLVPIINTDNIDVPTSGRYDAFIKNVPDDAWETKQLISHLDSLLPQIAARHNNPHEYLERIFPAVASVLHHASPAVLGTSLQTLFSQAKGQPNHYALLHSWMATSWPKPSDMNPYNPQQIFSDGVAFTATHPQFSSKGLLKSLREMYTRKLVPEDQRSALITAACSTWASAPDRAIDTFTHGYSNLTPEQTANLIDAIDWTNDEQQTLLSNTWSIVSESQVSEDLIHSTNRILEKGVRGPEDEPDRALRLWLESQGESISDVLKSAITQVGLIDIHRKRLWQQASRLAESLGSGFFLDVIPSIVVLSPIEETADSLFLDYDRISETLGSTDNRAEMSQHLMKLFPEVATKTVKSLIVDWCKNLNGGASLRVLTHESLTDDDMSILESHFGNTQELKKLKKGK